MGDEPIALVFADRFAAAKAFVDELFGSIEVGGLEKPVFVEGQRYGPVKDLRIRQLALDARILGRREPLDRFLEWLKGLAQRLADLGRDLDPRRWYGSNVFDLVVRRPVGKCPTDTRSNENQTDEYSTHSAWGSLHDELVDG